MFTDVFHQTMLTERHRKLLNHANYQFALMEPGEMIIYDPEDDIEMPDIKQLKKAVSITAKRIRLKYDKKFQLSCKHCKSHPWGHMIIMVTRIE